MRQKKSETVPTYPVESIRVDLIDDGDNVSRSHYNGIDELATSLKDYAELLTVASDGNGRYICIAGHRRLRAHRKNGTPYVLCYVIDCPDPGKRALLTAQSNVRDNGTTYDWLKQLELLHLKYKHSSKVLAKTLNKGEPYIKQCIVVVQKIHPDIMAALRHGEVINITTLIEWSGLEYDAQWRAYEYRHRTLRPNSGSTNRIKLSRKALVVYRDELNMGTSEQQYAANVLSYLLGERERPE